MIIIKNVIMFICIRVPINEKTRLLTHEMISMVL